MSKDKCTFNKNEMLIFPCSGGSNVGQIANEATKDLTALGWGKMYCLAGIGGKDNGIVASTKAAKRIIVIDGCSVQCARKTLGQSGFIPDLHVIVTDLGIKKNSFFMDVSEIETVIDKISSDENED
jgi:uncharacterized metal-binding protein